MATAQKSMSDTKELAEVAQIYADYSSKMDEAYVDFLKKLADLRRKADQEKITSLLTSSREG